LELSQNDFLFDELAEVFDEKPRIKPKNSSKDRGMETLRKKKKINFLPSY
jgi:hypothetical protein